MTDTGAVSSRPDAVARQYASAANLNLRASLHDRYSVNRQGFMPWLFGHYAFRSGDSILELGCGDGRLWKGRLDRLPEGCRLLLTDLSAGMLDAARENLGAPGNVEYAQADIQSLFPPDGCFDAVIANMMLYHVPDLERALSEVRRVLKPGGTFYCATYGEFGVTHFLAKHLAEFGVTDALNRSFTRQNGGERLRRFFRDVRWEEYADALEVTEPEDVADYLYSLTGMADLDPARRPAIVAKLRGLMEGGVLRIPKEYGTFICRQETQHG